MHLHNLQMIFSANKCIRLILEAQINLQMICLANYQINIFIGIFIYIQMNLLNSELFWRAPMHSFD